MDKCNRIYRYNTAKIESLIPSQYTMSDIYERAYILYSNGFGFQPTLDHNHITLCNINQDELTKIDELVTIAPSVRLVGDAILIEFKDYRFIDDLLNKLIELGVTFRTTSHLGQANFSGTQYSRAASELQYIEMFSEWIDTMNSVIDPRCEKSWNWITEQGREFSKKLCKSRNLPECNLESRDNYLRWGMFSNCDSTTLEINPAIQKLL